MQGPYMELVNKFIFKKLVNLKSVSDTNLDLQPILKKKFFFENFFTDYNQILNDKKIDVVLILTSMKEHAKIAKQALLEDKHVLVEKPMATNMKELDGLFKIAKSSNKFLIPAPFVTLSPTYQAIKSRVKK
jgi:predicted dehydrogenase